jgi:hypothetical protein
MPWLERVLRSQLFAKMKRCYQRELAEGRLAEGHIVLHLDVMPSGSASVVVAKNQLSPQLADCAVRAASAVVFPAAAKEERSQSPSLL